MIDAARAVVDVERYLQATTQIAQTTLRSVLGKADLDMLLTEREQLNEALQHIVDEHTDPWGIKVTAVEIKDVEIPSAMQRAMALGAEAERERRAKIIHAEGEFQASQRLRDAADVISGNPASLQLRYLQTLTEIGGTNNSTVVFPLPLDIVTPFIAGGTTASAEEAADHPLPVGAPEADRLPVWRTHVRGSRDVRAGYMSAWCSAVGSPASFQAVKPPSRLATSSNPSELEGERGERGARSGPAVDDHAPGRVELGVVARARRVGRELEHAPGDLHRPRDVLLPLHRLADVEEHDVIGGHLLEGVPRGDAPDLRHRLADHLRCWSGSSGAPRYPSRVPSASSPPPSGSLLQLLRSHSSSSTSVAACSRNCGAAHSPTSKSLWM